MDAKTRSTYHTDFVAWALEQAALLRAGRHAELDIAHIAEEIEALSRHDKRELDSRLRSLMAHLLKWQYQPDHRTPSWKLTIDEQRMRLKDILSDKHSLRPYLRDPERLALSWWKACLNAEHETGLHGFPRDRPWTLEQILERDFFSD